MRSIKLLGVLLVLGTGLFAALWRIGYEKRKLEILDAWISLIAYIRNQIDCYLTPINEILSQKETPKIPLCDQKNRSLKAFLEASAPYLNAEELRLLGGFVREIGSHYREEQIKQCNYYINSLRPLRERRAAELPARLRVTLAIALCSSLGISILLW